jgi:hypothetical protein
LRFRFLLVASFPIQLLAANLASRINLTSLKKPGQARLTSFLKKQPRHYLAFLLARLRRQLTFLKQ